jgi:hypothetical protein
MPHWGAAEHENGFLSALRRSMTCPHDRADHGSAGSREGVVFKAVAMPRWGTTGHENGFLSAPGGSVTRSHNPADHGSTGSREGVIFKAVAMPRWGTTKDENGCVHRLCFANRLNVVHSWQELV